MVVAVVSFLTFLVTCALAHTDELKTVAAAFRDQGVTRDLHLSFNPQVPLHITFPNNVHVDPGIHLTRRETEQTPVFSAPGLTGGPFVLAVVDPDAPTPQSPSISQYRHFLGEDFYPNSQGVLLSRTPAITPYQGPSPPAESDPHRYVFLLYKQSAGFDSQKFVVNGDPLIRFNVTQFAADTGLGQPIAGNFMVVGPDDRSMSLKALSAILKKLYNVSFVTY